MLLDYFFNNNNLVLCNDPLILTYKNNKSIVLKQMEYKNTLNISDNWKLYIPSNFSYAAADIYNLLKYNQIYFKIINGFINMDYITCKKSIWNNLVKKYKKNAVNIMPLTYNIDDNIDEELFNNKKVYFLKKNVQRQSGISLVKKMPSNIKEFIIIQEAIDNPMVLYDNFYKINRKINFRVYVLVYNNGFNTNFYIYEDGFLYYTPQEYKYNTNPENMITTGYIDRKVYQYNCLTLKELSKKMKTFDIVWSNVVDIVSKTFSSIKWETSLFNKHFQIFGVDIQPQSDNNCKILEVNKDPDLGSKGPRDTKLKHTMMTSVMNIVHGKYNSDNGFVCV